MRRRVFIAALAAAAVVATSRTPFAQSPAVIDKVEEDWELVVGTPAPDEEGPQITMTMSPTADNSKLFAAFNMNYRDSSYRAGGLQVQAWLNQKLLITQDAQEQAQLNTSNEKITWTQSLQTKDGQMIFAVSAGKSTTWGAFGSGDDLDISWSTVYSDLSGYDPAVSVSKSGVTWQSNRVTSLKLLKVRYYSGSTLVKTDSTPRSVNLAP